MIVVFGAMKIFHWFKLNSEKLLVIKLKYFGSLLTSGAPPLLQKTIIVRLINENKSCSVLLRCQESRCSICNIFKGVNYSVFSLCMHI